MSMKEYHFLLGFLTASRAPASAFSALRLLKPVEKLVEQSRIPSPDILRLKSSEIPAEMSVRLSNALKYSSYHTVHDILSCDGAMLLKQPNFGKKCLRELRIILWETFGLTLIDRIIPDTPIGEK